MQIQDLFSQYQNLSFKDAVSESKNASAETIRPEGNEAANPLKDMSPGQVFSGAITKVDGNNVTLSLDGGENISAKLDDGIMLKKGENFLFEVKDNAGGKVFIRPMSFSEGNNMMLLSALKSANLKGTEENINMVKAMMDQKMPIDAASLNDMAKSINKFPGTNPESVVLMKHYDIPVTKEMVSQFESYRANEGEIMNAFDDMVDSMVSAFTGDDVSAKDIASFQDTLVKTLQLSGEDEGDIKADENIDPEEMEKITENEGEEGNGVTVKASSIHPSGEEAIVKESGLKESSELNIKNEENISLNNNIKNPGDEKNALSPGKETIDTALKKDTVDKTGLNEKNDIISSDKENLKLNERADIRNTVLDAVGKEGLKQLNKLLNDFPEIKEKNPSLFDENNNIKPDVKVSDALNKITEAFKNTPELSKEKLLDMVSSDPYKKLIHNLMEESWTVSPEDLKKENKIQHLYEKLETHMQQLEETAKHLTNNPENNFSKTAENVRENIDFMNHVNQNFTYVQIPIRFSNQSATGDLYVIKNKKTAYDPNEPLSAFLHFDLEHLGQTDISVKLIKNNVDTNFFMPDDESFKLLSENIGALEERLKNKGYNVKINVTNDDNPKNLVKDVIMDKGENKEEQKRFSFDARA